MTGLHLSHKVSWKDLLEYFVVYKDHGIELPIGNCGRIHLINRKTQIQVNHRKYLANQVCTDLECKVTASKVFRKSLKKKISLTRFRPNYLRTYNTKQLSDFIDCFSRAICEFAETERKKVGQRNVVKTDLAVFHQEIIEKLKEEKRWLKSEEEMKWYRSWCSRCQLFTILIEAADAKKLFSFSDKKIKSVLSCTHGGQAVGNNFNFLSLHVLTVYLCTNLIVASGLQDNPEEWGPMRPGSYFRRELMYDCDGQTFLYSSRRFLTDDVYMKDWEAMRQLCKNCFQFLYFTEMLRQEIKDSYDRWNIENLKQYIYDGLFW
jgi:hypothetical protein